MENNKLERIIFKLLRIFGVLSIIGGYFGEEGLLKSNSIRVGHMIFISPIAIVGILVSITIYLVFISFLEKHISITKESI